ncbi:Gfo/Idh/MocA family oxidoreductase [Paenibacillus antri]|uniref:Gfo/Idh/MocA family oxidoreductase n=1 Tax=Paenibacillus antri TaxID=2582848 RepID=A0A5R9GC05_9BACL|nr:Gfo/Idh/MocA family oxidoreductase [Paenibacillus antri]TLS52619.1 Gfo/Idh/MocA family oxidoreductase [Paenibacillus antri]
MKRVKVGVIGLGEVAQIIHLPILQALSDRYEVVALCDISPSLVAWAGERYGVDALYTDAHELVRREDIDAVFVLNSDEYHAEHAIAAIRQGKHVLIEKPMTLTVSDADALIAARDEAGVQVLVGYMRRYAPAFEKACEELASLGPIQYARIRDIIGQNAMIIEQSSVVRRFQDIPKEASDDRWARAKRMVDEAVGDVPQPIRNSYRLLAGLNSHDLSAMRELLGMPKRVVSASHWNDGYYITATFEFDGYHATFETGVDHQRRFDAHIEVFGKSKQMKIQYDTPYIRHLPTTLQVSETVGDAYRQSVHRPTFKDPYTVELERFYDVVAGGAQPKTTPEDYKEDLALFKMICDALLRNYSSVAQ